MYVIFEEPKVSRAKVNEPLKKADEPKVDEPNSTEETTPPDFSTKSKDELMKYIQACENADLIQPLTGHTLKTIREAAVKRIEELTVNA